MAARGAGAGLLVFLAVRYRRPAYFWAAFFLHFLLEVVNNTAYPAWILT